MEFFYEIPQSRKTIAEQMGIPFDKRSKWEVLKNLKDSGVNAYPNVIPKFFVESNGLSNSNGRIFPLGGISNITSVLSNESGYYPVIETDEHGFNNPKGLYEINKVDIVLTGDSYTEGYSVHSDETIGAILKESGFNAICIGKAYNGSLIELAALKEYAEPLKPKTVLWVYYENDLEYWFYEIRSSFLLKYMNEGNFSQNLISRQKEIDSLLVDYVEVERERQMEEKQRQRIINIILLKKLRTRINLVPTPTPTPTPSPIFKEIMQKAKQMVSAWEGKIYFVYLPSIKRYSTGIEDVNREFALQTVTELEIPIIDMQKEVFDPHPDPLSLFPFRTAGDNRHYNADGYRLVAELISKRLKSDGIIPLNSKN